MFLIILSSTYFLLPLFDIHNSEVLLSLWLWTEIYFRYKLLRRRGISSLYIIEIISIQLFLIDCQFVSRRRLLLSSFLRILLPSLFIEEILQLNVFHWVRLENCGTNPLSESIHEVTMAVFLSLGLFKGIILVERRDWLLTHLNGQDLLGGEEGWDMLVVS